MSKKRKLGNRFDEYTEEKGMETFGNREFDDDVFAAMEGEKVSNDTLNIMEIRADITQPRRIIPREIRGSWNGMPEGVPALLDKWAHEAGVSASMVEKMLAGSQSVHSVGGVDPVLDEFAKLIDLASQIFDVGLQQRIGVSTVPGGYQVIFGERRWMAFHCLAHWISDEWHQIPAKVASVSPWELAKIQAAENFQRVELNAIEKARQFAKLLIVSRADSTDVPYDSWNALVVEGGCDRPYYAQVADGNIHRIPRGMGQQFEQALGISTAQMRQYRKLLKLTDDYELNNLLWDKADEMNWGEGILRRLYTIPQEVDEDGLREQALELLDKSIKIAVKENYHIDIMELIDIKDSLFEEFITPNITPHTVTRVTVSHDTTPEQGEDSVTELAPNPARPPIIDSKKRYELTQKYLNKRVVLRGGKRGTVINIETMGLRVRLDDGATPIVDESVIVQVLDAPDKLSRAQLEALTVRYAGYYVRLRGDRAGEVFDVKNDGRIEILVHGQTESSLHDESEIESVINGAAYLAFTQRNEETETDSAEYENDSDSQVDEYEPPASLGDVADKEVYEDAVALLDSHSDSVYVVLNALYHLAQKLSRTEDRDVVQTLMTYSSDDVDIMAEEMSAEEFEALIVSYEKTIASLLETAMREVEHYTGSLREKVADERELV